MSVFTSTTTLTISWSQPSYNGGSSILDYNVYVSANNNLNFYKYNNTGSSSIMTITVNSVTRGQVYYFKVTAVNDIGESSFS